MAGPFGPGRPGFGGPTARKDLMETADSNKDGKVTKEEFAEQHWTLISKADTDKDGAVSKDELEAQQKKVRESSNPNGGRNGSRFDPRGRGSRWPGSSRPGTVDRMLSVADKNKDGQISKDEVPDFLWQRLSKDDADKSETLSKEELEAHFKPRGPGRPDSGKAEEKSDTKTDSEKASDKPTDKAFDKSAEKAPDKSADQEAAQPDQKSDQKSEDKPNDKAADAKSDAPTA